MLQKLKKKNQVPKINADVALQTLVELRNEARRMRRIYDQCNTKTYCNGNKSMQEAYDVSRLSEWNKTEALNYAIRLIKGTQSKKESVTNRNSNETKV